MIIKIILSIFFALLMSFFIFLNLYFFAFGIIFLLFLFAILSKKIEYGLYIMACWIPLQYFVTKYYTLLPWHFVWVDEIILIVMFLSVILKKIVSKEKINICTTDKAVLAFLVLALISSAINMVNPIRAILGIRDFLQYYLLYLIVKNINLDEKVFKNLSRIVIVTLIIQLPVGLYQFFSWKPTYMNKLTGEYVNVKGLSYYDAVVGTFGIGANNFGYLMAIFILFFWGLFLSSKNKKWLFFSLYLFPVFCFARGVGAFFIFFVSLIFYKVRSNNLLRFVFMLFVFLILFFASANFYEGHFHKKDGLFNLDKYIQQQLDVSQGSSGRLIGIKITNDLLLEKSPFSLIGFGPGNFSSFTGRRFNAPRYVEAINVLHSDRCFTENDIVAVMGEYGYLGYIIFLMIAFCLFKRNEYIGRSSHGLLHNLCFSAKGGFFIFLAGSVLTNIWSAAPIAFYVWFFSGCIESMFLQQKL